MDINKKVNVLILDDDKINIQVLSSILRESYNVYYTTNQEEALKILGRIKIDLIILDVIMPGVNGIEFLKILRNYEKMKKIPAIFITSKRSDEYINSFNELGAEYMFKPIDTEGLKEKIKKIMNKENQNLTNNGEGMIYMDKNRDRNSYSDSVIPNVLIVDDDEMDINIIEGALNDKYVILSATTTEKALTVIKNTKIDLILLDVMMPFMNGFEFCKMIKESKDFKDIVVIFITVKGNVESIVKGFQSGAVDYITKPFEILELNARVKNHIDLQRAKDYMKQQNIILEKMVKERTKELEAEKEIAENANRAKSEFISNINHELRTPLNGILGLTDMLKMDLEGKYYQGVLSDILACGNTLLGLITSLIDFSSIKSKSIIEKEQNFDLVAAIEEVVERYVNILNKKSLYMNIRNHVDDRPMCLWSKSKFQMVIFNIVSNAVKFTEQGGIDIDIYLKEEENKNFIIIEISDTGIGIDKEYIGKMYQEFVQGEYYLTKKYGGLGLGLSMTKEIIDNVKGKIKIESEKENGTKVTLQIPQQHI